jgi:hypothetical protein
MQRGAKVLPVGPLVPVKIIIIKCYNRRFIGQLGPLVPSPR